MVEGGRRRKVANTVSLPPFTASRSRLLAARKRKKRKKREIETEMACTLKLQNPP
jgi:hypothetical protein